MADSNIKLVSLQNLKDYDVLIKKYIGDADAVVDAKSIKNVAVVEDAIYFFKSDDIPTLEGGAVDVSKAVKKVDIASSDVAKLLTDVAELQGTVAGYSSTSTVASAISAAQKAAEDHADAAVKALEDGAVATNAAAIASINNTETGILAQASALVKALEDGQVTTNKNDIAAINDETTGILKTAKDYTDVEVKKVNDLVGFVAGEDEDDPKTVKAYIDAEVTKATGDASQVASDLAAEITRATGAESDLADAIQAHKDAIDDVVTTLVGSDTNKSVRTIANEELAAQLIPESAKESLDTLEEIAAWIQSHPDDASAMNKAISDLQTQVGVEASGEGEDAVAATGLVKDIRDLQAAVGEGGAVADQIQTAIEELDSEETQTAGADGLALHIKVEDGVVTEFSGSIAAQTYDAYGAAAAVQTDLDAYKYTVATNDEINKLFEDEVEEA